MNLIFIYGPPASGKLTIGTELSRLTGYKLFHNHQTRNIVQDLYPDNLSEHHVLVEKLRLDIIKYTARHKTDLIFTFVYDDITDMEFVNKIINTVESENGKVLFVETTASKDVLLDRVDDDFRKQHKKLIDKSILEENINTGAYESLPIDNIFKVDTGAQQPEESALLIAKYYKLLA